MQHNIVTHLRLFGALALAIALMTSILPALLASADTTPSTDTPTDTPVVADTFTTYLPMVIALPPVPSCVSDNRDYELQVMALINAERQKNGLPALVEHAALTLAACRHSRDMADNKLHSHTGSDGSDAFSRMRDAGYDGTPWTENIAWWYSTPQQVEVSWMNSPKHRSNILSPDVTDFGVGYAENTANQERDWTVDFGKR